MLTKDSCHLDFFTSKCIQAIPKTTCCAISVTVKILLHILMAPNRSEMPIEQLPPAHRGLVTAVSL